MNKQQIALWRPDHAYHANDLLRAVFTPVLDTDDNLWQGMLFGRRLQAYDTISYLLATATGRIYSADIQIHPDFSRSGWGSASAFPSGAQYTYVSYNDNTGTADTLQVTIPQGYGTNAKIKLLCVGGPASGIVKITIDGAATLVNGDDTYLDGSDRKLDCYISSDYTSDGIITEFELAKNLDTSGGTYTLVLTETNTKNASSSDNRLYVAAIVTMDMNTEVDPDSASWMEGLFRNPCNGLGSVGSEQLTAYQITYNTEELWMGGGHFDTSSSCDIKDPATDSKDGESWVYDYVTAWSPAAGDRQVAAHMCIEQDFRIEHNGNGTPANLVDWHCDIVVQPGKLCMTKDFKWLASCTIDETASYDLLVTLQDGALRGVDKVVSNIKVPNQDLVVLADISSNKSLNGVSSCIYYGGLFLVGCEVKVEVNRPVEKLYIVKRTGTAQQDYKLYFVIGDTNDRSISSGDEWVSSTMLLYRKPLDADPTPFRRGRWVF